MERVSSKFAVAYWTLFVLLMSNWVRPWRDKSEAPEKEVIWC